MAKWLDKYEQGGLVLKKKTKDNYGTKPNVNDAKVSAGPGFEGDGYMAQNWRSPAWGGQFEMGGSLPGSVGFMYARTQNPAPANGKYTKKTLASAQNGTSKRKDLTEKEYYNPDEPTYKSGNAQIDFLASNPWLMKLPIIGDKIKEEAYKQASKSSFPIRTNKEIAGKSKVAGEKEFLNTKGYQGVWNEDANDPKNVDLLKQYIYGDQNLPLSQYSPKDDYYKFLPSYSLKQRLSTNSTIDKATRLSPVQKKDLEEVIKTRKPKFYHRFDTSDDPALSNIDTQVFYDKAPDLGHYRSGLGYDEDIDTPYAFVTDAWDFYPADYEKDQHLDKENPTNNVEYQQSYLLHKVGKPYKIYDRTYIDPKTKSAVSDKEVGIKKIISNVTPHTPGVSKEERKRRNQYLWNLKGKSYNPNMQNGGEMQYYQNGLDFNPKTISMNGKKLTKAQKGRNLTKILDLDKPMYPYISNDQIPSRKQVENKIIKDEEAKQEIAIKKNKDKQGYIRKAEPEESLASRTLNILAHPQTALNYKLKGYDIPDHFERGETATGEGLANIMNPFFYVNEARLAKNDLGDYADQVKEKGFYHANPYILGSGALHAANVLPVIGEAAPFISKAAKYIPTSSRYISELEALGHVQTAGINRQQLRNIFGAGQRTTSATQAEANAAMEGLDDAIQRGATRRVQPSQYAPYQPPTDAELAQMNAAEANRYFRRPSQEVTPNPDNFDWSVPRRGTQSRGISQQQIDDLMSREEYIFYDERGREVGRSRDPNTRVEDFLDEEGLARWQNRFNTAPSAPATSGIPQHQIDSIMNNRSDTPGPLPITRWGKDKDFKIGDAIDSGTYTDIEGNSFSQDVLDWGDSRVGSYKISDPEGGYMQISTRQELTDPNAYLKVNNMTFKNDTDASAAKQFQKIMAHLPDKVDMGEISTSIYSQPLMNQQVARWANNNPGRIEVNNIKLETLNPWHKGMDFPTDPLKGYPKYGNKLDQIKQQFPKLQKTVKSMSQSTGVHLPEPRLEFFDMDLDVPTRRPITIEELNSPEFKRKLQQDPSLGNKVTMKAPTYELIKHWRNGGHFVDPMGQWAYPGEITTIPSNDITMKGVNYDVMGISNTGDKKLMKPGKNYKFDGDYVTEYPRGGWLEKYK